jgi:hypothetical protein
MTRSNPRQEPCECYLWYTSLAVLQRFTYLSLCVHVAGYGKKTETSEITRETARRNLKGKTERQN